MLLLAGVALLLPALLAPSLHRVLRWALAVAPAASLVLLGLEGLRSGMRGDVVSSALTPAAALVWVLLWPVALTLGACVEAARAPGRRSGWGVATAFVVGCSTPLPVLLVLGPVASGGYASYDTAPWSDAAMAPVLLLGALTLWGGIRARSASALAVPLDLSSAGPVANQSRGSV